MSGSGPSFCKNCGDLISTPGSTCKACGGSAVAGKAGTFLEDGQTAFHTRITDRYVSGAHNTDMNDALRRMADVKPEWVDKECTQCHTVCSEGAFEAPTGPFRGKPLCEDCYARNFSKGECVACHKFVIQGEYIKNDDGRIWHAECYTDEHRCGTCRQPIFGEVVNACGKDYHPKCFQCGRCQKPLQDSFVDYHGSPYCKACADETKSTRTNQVNNPNDPAVKLREANNAAAVHRQGELEDLKKMKHVALGDTCTKCSQEIISNAVTVGTGMYHEECFVCTKCGKGFPDGKFSAMGGKLYHAACAKTAGEKCPACDKPISGKFLDYNGQKIHADCFKCTDCKKSLAGESFGESQGKAYCANCVRNHGARGPSGVHTGTYTPGFTVNPVTGEKEQRGYGGAKIGTPQTGLGTKDMCPQCSKPVYMTDTVPGPKMSKYHRKCLVCSDCGKWLDSNANVRSDGKMYCRDCNGKY